MSLLMEGATGYPLAGVPIIEKGSLMRRVYFDYNATTPIHPDIAIFVKPFFRELFGNPSSLHWAGRDVRPYVDEAREQVAAMMKAKPG